MGSKKNCKFYCLILLFLLLSSCGITIREYKLHSIDGRKIKISLTNYTHEPNLTALFTKTIEEKLIKRGAEIVDTGEEYFILVVLKDLKSTAASYTSQDIIGTYTINISGSFSIKEKSNNTPAGAGVFNISNSYNIKSISDSEIERAFALKKAATEVAEAIYAKLAILSQKP